METNQFVHLEIWHIVIHKLSEAYHSKFLFLLNLLIR